MTIIITLITNLLYFHKIYYFLYNYYMKKKNIIIQSTIVNVYNIYFKQSANIKLDFWFNFNIFRCRKANS